MADDPATKALARIRSRAETARNQGREDEYAEVAPVDVLRLLDVVGAALKLPGEWEADAAELDRDVIRGRKSQHTSDYMQADTDEALAGTLRECATALREAVTRELIRKENDSV